MSSPSIHHLSVRRTARILAIGAPRGARHTLLIALHGYAQRAEEFAAALEPLLRHDPAVGILVPEALSRFYRRGATGEEVGASWMTRLDRLHEIDDYLHYLDRVEEEMVEEGERVVVLGFSQGAATAARWALHSAGRVARVVLWGGAIPPEIENDSVLLRQLPHTLLIHGDSDPLVRGTQLEQQERALREHGVHSERFVYKGGHEITPEGLQRVVGRTPKTAGAD